MAGPTLKATWRSELGESQRFMGGREQHPLEFGVFRRCGADTNDSAEHINPAPERAVQDIWGLGCDLQCVLTERLGVKAEAFVGQTLGDYNAGVLQNFNSLTFIPIQTGAAILKSIITCTHNSTSTVGTALTIRSMMICHRDRLRATRHSSIP